MHGELRAPSDAELEVAAMIAGYPTPTTRGRRRKADPYLTINAVSRDGAANFDRLMAMEASTRRSRGRRG